MDLGSPSCNLRNYSCVTFSESFSLEETDAECLAAIKEALSNPGKQCDGVVIIIDELGKALDYQAASGGDLHFFQSLADAVQSNSNVVVIGLLHQSFAAYARKRDSSTQNEWGKVQGRYKDFRFNPSADESLYLVGESFQVEETIMNSLVDHERQSVEVVVETFGVARRRLSWCCTDPVVASLLRPIFGAVSLRMSAACSVSATHERYGFRDYLQQQEKGSAFTLYRVEAP